jgi:hypothetical protein
MAYGSGGSFLDLDRNAHQVQAPATLCRPPRTRNKAEQTHTCAELCGHASSLRFNIHGIVDSHLKNYRDRDLGFRLQET